MLKVPRNNTNFGKNEKLEKIDHDLIITKTFIKYFKENQLQSIFCAVTLVVAMYSWHFIRIFDGLVQERINENPRYQWPKYEDFLIGFISAFCIGVVRAIYNKVFYKVAKQITKDCATEVESEGRTQKILTEIYKSAYFLVDSLFAYYILKDGEWIPKEMLGEGDSRLMFKNFPYESYTPTIRLYYQVHFGYHFMSLIFHFVGPIRSDFFEMLLHHLITIALIFLSYMMNYLRIGSLVMFIHDIADLVGYFSRSLVEIKHVNKSKILYLFYALFLVSWFYTRLYVFPLCVLSVNLQVKIKDNLYGLDFMTGLLCVLFVLHVYWFSLLLKAGYKKIKGQEFSDQVTKIIPEQ